MVIERQGRLTESHGLKASDPLLNGRSLRLGYIERRDDQIDYPTQRRIPTDSARWYGEIARGDGLA